MNNLFIILILYATIAIYTFARLRFELQMLQQNSYRNKRYANWLRSNLLTVERLSDVALLVACAVSTVGGYVQAALAGVYAVKIFFGLTRKYKKKLVFTHRAIRLYCTAGVLVAVVWPAIVSQDVWVAAVVPVASCGIIMLANLILTPLETAINHWYYNDAKRILSHCNHLIIIGITGSYGKTSTKHYLHDILSEKFNVLMTPGSFNTTLGVVRTIREQLKPYHEIFIVEMGAKQPGDIKEICDLVNPTLGIITSVGEQHLESFKTVENIRKTKFELFDAIPNDGFIVLNNDFDSVANTDTGQKNTVRYSANYDNPNVDFWLNDMIYSPEGTRFTIESRTDSPVTFETKIAGRYNLSNLLSAYILAKHLGVETEAIQYAVSHIAQVEHRLGIKQTPQGITVIDDAFNSNPLGAQMALEVLQSFGQKGKRFLVTPGIVELGDKLFYYNQQLGNQAATACDYAIIVGVHNREAIVEGLIDGGFDNDHIYLADSFKDAVNYLNAHIKAGDAVLYENDLPDTFR